MTVDSHLINDLIAVSIDFLGRMQLETGHFCTEVVKGDRLTHGCSLRYTLMVLIGLTKASAAGWSHPFDVERIRDQVFRELEDPAITPGDLGLCLWLDSRVKSGHAAELVTQLSGKLNKTGGFPALVGMELAWIVLGLAFNKSYDRSTTSRAIFDQAFEELVRRQDQRTGLLHHFGNDHFRKRFPNFATQIYGVLAMAAVAKLGFDRRALTIARRIADCLISLQLSDGGWPWLFDAQNGMVIEPYEIYSVHQDGMAPMALLDLSEVSRDPRYAIAAIKGLKWIYGNNEFNYSMINSNERLIFRSIRRKKPWNWIALYTNVASTLLFGKAFVILPDHTEINATCRPYHLGWVLEAWCGRELDAMGGG